MRALRSAGRLVACALAAGVFAACPAPPPPPPPAPPAQTYPMAVKLRGEIFASTWAVTIIAPDAATALRAKTVEPVVQATLLEVERQISSWKRDSELAKFNRTVWAKPLPQSAGLLTLTKTALAVGRDTDGAFDITIGPLLDLWGFSPATKGTVKEPPSAAAIAAAKAKTGLKLIHVVDGGLKKDREDLTIDLTAIGDGAAAAAVMTAVAERGFDHVLVDVAGEVVVRGAGLAAPWKVGVNTPKADADPSSTAALLTLAPAPGATLALSTSGTYREAFTAGGVRYAHILDPRTGAPVTHNLVSCSVVGADVVIADALSTACVVLGVDGTKAVLPRFAGYEVLFLSEGEGGAIVEERTAGFPPSVPTSTSTPSPSPTPAPSPSP